MALWYMVITIIEAVRNWSWKEFSSRIIRIILEIILIEIDVVCIEF